MRRAHRWIITTIVLVLLLIVGAATALYYVTLPAYLKGRLESAFDRIENRFAQGALEITVSNVEPDLSGRVAIPRLSVRDDTHELARVEQLVVTLDPLSFLYGAGVVESIEADRVHLEILEADAKLLRRLIGAKEAPSLGTRRGPRTGGAKRSASSAKGSKGKGRVPLIKSVAIRAIDGRLALQGNEMLVESGHLDASSVSMLVDEPEYLLEAGARLGDGNGVRATLRLSPNSAKGSISFDNKQILHLAGQEVSFRNLHLDLPGRLGLEEIEILPALSVARVAIPFRRFDGDPRRMLLEALKEPIAVTKPTLRVDSALIGTLLSEGLSAAGAMQLIGRGEPEAPTSPAATEPGVKAPEQDKEQDKDDSDALPALPKGTKVAKSSRLFHGWLRPLLWSSTRRLEKALIKASKLRERIPIRDLSVEDGTILFSEEVLAQFPLLSNIKHLDSHVEIDEDGSFEAILEYETAASKLFKNRLLYRASADGDVTLGLRLDRVPAYPFQEALPAFLTVDPDSRIEGLDVEVAYERSSREATLSLKADLKGLNFFDERISSFDLRDQSLRANLRARLSFADSTLVIERGDYVVSGIPLELTGSVEAFEACPTIHFAFRLLNIGLQDLLAKIPRGLIPLLEGVVIKGEMEFRFEGGFNACDVDGLAYKMIPLTKGVKVEDMGSYIDFETPKGRFEKEIIEGKDKQGDDKVTLREFGPGTPSWTPLELVPPNLIKVVTTTEDGSFFEHLGFSAYNIRKAFVQNIEKMDFYRGASTISQQVVKNVFLTREKTVSRKIQELFITWQLEETYTKEEILEIYFNIIELGPDIYGVKEAAQAYFCKRPRELNLLECLFLSSILPSPKLYSEEFYERGRITRAWSRYLERLLGIMVNRNKISIEEKEFYAPYELRFHTEHCPLPLEIDLVPGMDLSDFMTPEPALIMD